MTTDKPRQYDLPDLGDLTANDLFVIKASTKVDLMSPPTVVHGDAALLWFASKKTDTPLVFADLLEMPLDKLGDLISDKEPEPVPEPSDDDEEPVLPQDEVKADGPKASETSRPSSSGSVSDSGKPLPPFGIAPSESSD